MIVLANHGNSSCLSVIGFINPLSQSGCTIQSDAPLGKGWFQFSSVAQPCPTPWTAAGQAPLSITNSWNLPKLMSIESAIPSNHLILCQPLFLLPSILPRIRVFSSESVLHSRWPKYWSFSFSISPSNEYSGLISFNGLAGSPCSPRDSQESSPTPQCKSFNSSVLSFLYGPILTSIHGY